VRPKSLAIVFVLFLFILSIQAQEEPSLNPDLTLFVEDDIMTLYVSHSESVSLDGFQFQAEQDGELEIFSPEIRFLILEAQDYELTPGTCLVYQFSEDAEIPDVCDPNKVEPSSVGPGDRFWLDDDGNRQTIYFLKYGDSLRQPCTATSNQCAIYYNVERPEIVISTEVESPDWEFFPPISGVNPIINQSSNIRPINAIIFGPDDEGIITGHATGEICLWDNNPMLTTYVECIETEHNLGITALEHNPHSDSFQFASVGTNGYVYIWEISEDGALNETPIASFDHGEAINDLTWDPNSERIALTGLERLTLWDVQTGENPDIASSNYVTIDWRPDGQAIASIDNDGLVRVIDLSTAELNTKLIDNYGANVSGVDIEWNDINSELITLSLDGHVRLYNNTSLIEPCQNAQCASDSITQNLEQVTQGAISPNGDWLAIAAEGAIHVVNTAPPYILLDRYVLRDRRDLIFTSLAWNTDGTQLVAGDETGAIHIWNIEPALQQRLEPLRNWEVSPTSEVLGLSWNPTGELISFVDGNRKLSLWDTFGNLQGSVLAHVDRPLAIDWHPFSDVVATGGCGPSITIWQRDEIAQRLRSEDPENIGAQACVSALDFDNFDGSILVSANKVGILTVWDWAQDIQITARELALGNVGEPNPTINDVEWNYEGTQLAIVDTNGALQVFDMENRTPSEILVRQPDNGISMNSVTWSPDGRYVATASDGGWIEVWETSDENISSDQPTEGSYRLEGHEAPVMSVSWSSRNGWLASVDQDHRIIIWDVVTGQRLAEVITEFTPMVVQWVPVAPAIAVGDENGNISLYTFTFAEDSDE